LYLSGITPPSNAVASNATNVPEPYRPVCV
jgi:hypothetical protein